MHLGITFFLALLRSRAVSQVLLDLLSLGDLLGELGKSREVLLVGGQILWEAGADGVEHDSDGNIGVGVVSAGDELAVVGSDLLLEEVEHARNSLGLELVLQLLLAGLILLVEDGVASLADVANALESLVSLNSVLRGLASEVAQTSDGADDGRALDNLALLASLQVGELENRELLGRVLLLDGSPVGLLDADILERGGAEVEHPADELSAGRDVEVDDLQVHLLQIAGSSIGGVPARGGSDAAVITSLGSNGGHFSRVRKERRN